MFNWAMFFFAVALVAALLGFGGVAAGAADAAKITFMVALVLAVGSYLAGRGRGDA